MRTPAGTVQAAASADPNLPGDARVCTVVICDDQPELREVIRLTLAAASRFTVIADAGDADSCLKRVRETHPDVLILDVNMPGGGPHVAVAAKNIDPRLHIVVFSGREDSAVAQAMLVAGADQYVLKTGRVQPLLQAMENAYHQLTQPAAASKPSHGADPPVIPSHDEHVLDDQRCRCGSPIMYRRRVVMGDHGGQTEFAAWCHRNTEHRLPASIVREITEMRLDHGH